jgi:hypothetical protein
MGYYCSINYSLELSSKHMDKPKQPVLDEFGQLLMAQVRDQTLADLQRVVSGKMADESSRNLFDEFKKLNPESCEFVKKLLVVTVDAAIARFLYFLDDFQIEVRFRTSEGEQHDVRAISDGLHGEIWTEDGWIKRFSKFNADSMDAVSGK